MPSNRRYYLLCLCLSLSWAIHAQERPDFYRKPVKQGNGFMLRAGLTYTIPTVTTYYVNSSIPTSILWGVRPKTGFYVGGSYYTDLATNRLSLRFDGTLQQKSTKTVNPYNSYSATMSYYYAGFAPLIGLQLAGPLTIYTGPEVNLMIINKNAWGKVTPLDIGPTVKCVYSFQKIKAEISYSRGFVQYDHLDINLPGGPAKHDFYNQTLQAGLIYLLNI